MSQNITPLPSSYRDPSGFMFEKEGVLYRQVNRIYSENFDAFINSGCYDTLVKKGLLIPHQEVKDFQTDELSYKIIRPEPIAFISYPYEWSFEMLKDAALLTLQIMRESLDCGMIIKDATPYNIQWHKGKFIFIDTLSFETYHPEEPWIAYRQFCENFLGPLLLMHYSKNHLPQLFLAYPDGIPIAVVRSLLPARSKFSFHTYLHIHLHASVSGKKSNAGKPVSRFSKQKMLNLLSSLETLVRKLKVPARSGTWSGYYEEAAGRPDYLEQKKKIIDQFLDGLQGIKTAADLGANEGTFTRLLAARDIFSVAADLDPHCINELYNSIKKNGEQNIQPLVSDLSLPSPAIGVNNAERISFMERMHVDLVLALALVHHLAIGKNIPLELIAGCFQSFSSHLIIEFVPKTDPKIQEMLSRKKDIYANYEAVNFENSFSRYYRTIKKEPVGSSGRVLYLMSKHEK
jgi:hypothetical protein